MADPQKELRQSVAAGDLKAVKKFMAAFQKQQQTAVKAEMVRNRGRNHRGPSAVARALDINGRDGRGIAALHVAALSGNAEICEVLLSHEDTKVDIKTNKGWTPLMQCCQSSNTELAGICRILLGAGADTSLKNNLNQSALALAQLKRNQQVIDMIRSNDKMVERERQERGREKEFREHCLHGKVSVVTAILESGDVDVNALDKDRRTALHYATTENHVGVCKVLLKYGADRSIASLPHNETAWHIASQRGFAQLVAMLRSENEGDAGSGASK